LLEQLQTFNSCWKVSSKHAAICRKVSRLAFILKR
jgi:hypothetical protein